VGPFCGAFIPKDFGGDRPYIGIAFKGTNVTSEIINDLTAMETIRAINRLWNSQVSSGFYFPIFSTYNQDPSKMPFLMIQKAIQDIVTKAKTTAITHVTGHSLGGAYSSLSYAQMCIGGFGTTKASLGDLYTFGSPRVGRGDFAVPLKAAISPPANFGSSWRIVNYRDYVPKVPASPFWSSDPFIHINAAYMIYSDQKPTALPSEIGTYPTWSFPTAISPHYTTEYYKSLTYATTLKAPAHAVVNWGIHPLDTSTFSNANFSTLELDATCSPEISLEKARDCTIGTIKHSCFFGEITVLGVVGKLNRCPTFQFNASESWRILYKKENQCVCTKVNNETLKISFMVDGKQVAIAHVSTESGGIGDVTLMTGSCVWTFCEDNDKVIHALHRIETSAAGFFN